MGKHARRGWIKKHYFCRIASLPGARIGLVPRLTQNGAQYMIRTTLIDRRRVEGGA